MDYCKRLLDEYLSAVELRRIAFSLAAPEKDFFDSSGISLDSRKEEYVDFATAAIFSARVDLSYIALKLCRRAYTWFTMLTGEIVKFPQQQTLKQFFLTNNEGWFGPLNDSDTETSFYIYRRNVTDYVPRSTVEADSEYEEHQDASDQDMDNTDKSAVRVPIQRPFCVILEIMPRYAVLSWNGFMHHPEEIDEAFNSQFAFWFDIQNLLEGLPAWLPGLQVINAYTLILNNLWDRYRNHPDYSWEDVGARSEQDGVATHARAGGGNRKALQQDPSSMTLKGIAMLAERLANAALDRLNTKNPNIVTPENTNLAREAILEQIIKTGGIKSLEFALHHKLSQKLVLQSHVYFGSRPKGQDALIHFKTYQANGGADQASKFLAKELGVL